MVTSGRCGSRSKFASRLYPTFSISLRIAQNLVQAQVHVPDGKDVGVVRARTQGPFIAVSHRHHGFQVFDLRIDPVQVEQPRIVGSVLPLPQVRSRWVRLLIFVGAICNCQNCGRLSLRDQAVPQCTEVRTVSKITYNLFIRSQMSFGTTSPEVIRYRMDSATDCCSGLFPTGEWASGRSGRLQANCRRY